MDLTVEVTDASGAPIGGADISAVLSGVPINGKSDGQGKFASGPIPLSLFRIEVSHPAYFSEEMEITPPTGGGHFLWNNPVCSVTPTGVITFRLSRLQAAPTFSISDSELERRDQFNPQAVFAWTDHGGNPTGRYLAAFNNEKLFVPIGHPLLPGKPGEGWDRFNHSDPVKLDPSRTGNLVWLEWGLGGGQPRLLVAVWVPRFLGPTPTKLDFVVFFSPTTSLKAGFPSDKFPWLDPYPYQAVKGRALRKIKDKDGPPALTQPYPALGHRYLFYEKSLIYQLLAAKRQAIVIFPIQPSADWGPFGHAAGVARLIAEITHLLHRTGLTSGGQTSRDEDRALLPHYRFFRTAMHLPPPQAQRIVLSGFSAGVSPIVNMLSTSFGQKLADPRPGLNHALFGADVAPFLNAWMEVWDHDAPHDTRIVLEQRAPAWMNQNKQRMLRCYQSEDTGTPRDWIETTPLAQYTPSPVSPPVYAGAAERQADARCSLVYFDNRYLKHSTTAHETAPVFWTEKDAHQAVPMVTFGHAALLSRLARM